MIVGTEWIVIGVIIIVALMWGPSKIPEMARAVGRARKEFDDASRGITELASTSTQPMGPIVDTTRRVRFDNRDKTIEKRTPD